MLRLTLKPLRSPSQGPASLHSGLTGNNLVSADTKRIPVVHQVGTVRHATKMPTPGIFPWSALTLTCSTTEDLAQPH